MDDKQGSTLGGFVFLYLQFEKFERQIDNWIHTMKPICFIKGSNLIAYVSFKVLDSSVSKSFIAWLLVTKNTLTSEFLHIFVPTTFKMGDSLCVCVCKCTCVYVNIPVCMWYSVRGVWESEMVSMHVMWERTVCARIRLAGI